MAEKQSKEPKSVRPSPEFFVKVNDVLAIGNKVARRSNTATAQLVLLHALSRYAAHHYRSAVKEDSPKEREDFVTFMCNRFAHLFSENVTQLYAASEPAAAGGAASAPAKRAGKPGAG